MALRRVDQSTKLVRNRVRFKRGEMYEANYRVLKFWLNWLAFGLIWSDKPD